jgi:hypothetical protein
MNINTKNVLGFAAVAVVGYLIYKLYQDNKKTAGFAGGLGGKRWRVGGYNSNTNTTAIFNADNPSEVKYVKGRVNVAKDSIFSGR